MVIQMSKTSCSNSGLGGTSFEDNFLSASFGVFITWDGCSKRSRGVNFHLTEIDCVSPSLGERNGWILDGRELSKKSAITDEVGMCADL